MSDRPSEQGLSERSTRDGNDGAPRPQPTSPRLPNNTSLRNVPGIRSVTSPTAQAQFQGFGHNLDLPPLPSTANTPSGSFLPPTSRIGGVSSILNPSQSEDTQQNRRRKASQLESPASSVQSLPPIFAGAQGRQATGTLPAPSPGPQYAIPSERQPRRILTPRSPSLHRAASLGQLNQPAGTISAQRTPFPASPRSRAYAIEPGVAGAPPLPTPPAGARAGYGFPAPTPPEATGTRRASAGPTRAPGLSSSVSPSTSYSSYSQAEQTSPTTQYAPLSMAMLSAPYNAGSDGSTNTTGPSNTIGLDRHGHMGGIPISSSGGQNAVQMMTLDTTSGPINFPVDIQAASKMADEKRRRNAGASARFRQRRKEKEKEASTTISRLEQELKELSDSVDFYRRERDVLAGILQHTPGGQRHFPRPPSPGYRRASGGAMAGPSGTSNASYPPPQEQASRSPEGGRNVRRRTSTFSLPPPTPQSHLPAPGVVLQPNYGSQQHHVGPSGPLPPPLPRASLPQPSSMPPMQQQQQQQQQNTISGPPTVLQTPPQTGPWNPYASERRQSGPQGPPGPPYQPQGQ